MEFTEDQIYQIFADDGVWSVDDEQLFEVVDVEISYFDLGKEYLKKDFVLKELATGKFFKGKNLMETSDDFPFKINKTVIWFEVYPYTETITKYK